MKSNQVHRLHRRRRGRAAGSGVLILLVFVAASFLRLQIFSGEQYALRSSENRLRTITVPAPRGTIYDRYGRAIADNVPGYDVSLLSGPPDSIFGRSGAPREPPRAVGRAA